MTSNNKSPCIEGETAKVPQNASRRGRAIRWKLFFLVLPVALVAVYGGLYLAVRERHWERYLDKTSGSHKEELNILTPRWQAGKRIFAPAMWVERKLDFALRDDAVVIVDNAISKARSENKRVLLLFCTTSCLPCRYLDRLLPELSPILTKHFVVVKLNKDVARNGSAAEFRYRDMDPPGGLYIPWYVILDETGKPLITSDGPKGEMGCALGPGKHRTYFLHMLSITAPRITDEEIDEIDRLSKGCHDRMLANASQGD